MINLMINLLTIKTIISKKILFYSYIKFDFD